MIRSSIILLLFTSQVAFCWTFTDLKSTDVSSDRAYKWMQVAPGMAGSNRRIYADSVDPNKIWAVPDMGNDYLTTDGGKHWGSIVPHDGVWVYRPELSDECVMSDPKDPSVVISLVNNPSWQSLKQQIDISTDGGRTFTQITSYASGEEPNSAWFCAAPHPVDEGTWYLGNGNDFAEYRTVNNLNPINYIDTTQPKVWKITDITTSERTITAIPNDGMDDEASVFDILCHPDSVNYPDMLFAATSKGLYRRSDSSSSWSLILEGCCKIDGQWDGTTYTIYALQQPTYSIDGNTVASSGGVFVTSSPETISDTSEWDNKTAGLRVDLTGLSFPSYIFTSFVKRWFEFTAGEENSYVRPTDYFPYFDEIRCDPTNKNRVYLSNSSSMTNYGSVVTGGIWTTQDGGTSWYAAARMGTGFQNDTYWSSRQPDRTNRNMELQVHVKHFPDYWSYDTRGCRTMTIAADGTVYASLSKGYYTVKYDAEADWWTSVDNTLVGDVYFGHGNSNLGSYSVIPDIHRSGEMFLLQQEASGWKTTNETHSDYPGVIGVKEIHGMIDEGPTWAPGTPFIAPTALAQHPSDPDIFYYLTPRRGDFAKTSDNGMTFEVKGEPIEVPDESTLRDMIYWRHMRVSDDGAVYAVAEVIDSDNLPMGQTTIYNHSARKGVYKSTDEGISWTCVNNGLPQSAAGQIDGVVQGGDSACIKSLIMAPEDNDVLYAGAKRYLNSSGGYVDGGLFRTENGGDSWILEAIPAGIKSVWDVWMHTENGVASKIYIATGGDGSASDMGDGGVWCADYKSAGGYFEDDWTNVFDYPFCTHVRTSPFDDEYIAVATGESSGINDLNSGVYLTLTGGAAGDGTDWVKINYGRGPMPVSDLSFDGGYNNRLWVTGAAASTFCLKIPDGQVSTSKFNPRTNEVFGSFEGSIEYNELGINNSSLLGTAISSPYKVDFHWSELDLDNDGVHDESLFFTLVAKGSEDDFQTTSTVKADNVGWGVANSLLDLGEELLFTIENVYADSNMSGTVRFDGFIGGTFIKTTLPGSGNSVTGTVNGGEVHFSSTDNRYVERGVTFEPVSEVAFGIKEQDGVTVAARSFGLQFSYIAEKLVSESSSIETVEISLLDGYQIVSLDFVPETPDLKVLFGPVLDYIDFVQAKDRSKLYKKDGEWINDIGYWDSSQAYLLKVNGSPEPFTIHKSVTPLQESIPLTDGINIVPTYHTENSGIEVFLNSILDSNVVWVKDVNGNYFRRINDTWIDHIKGTNAGGGLIIKVSGDCSLPGYMP